MSLKKVGKISLGILGGALLLILLVVLFWLGPTVKLVAEMVGVKALGTPLTIEKLSINPRNGTVHLSGFTIENHDSFAKSNAVSLASLDLAIDMGSIFTSTVVVHQVEINSPHFVYEQSSASDNITEFMLNIQAFVDQDPAAPPKEEKPKKKRKSDKEPKIVVVESLIINDVKFRLANTEDPLLDVGVGFEQLSVSMTNGAVQLDNVYVRNPGRLSSANLFTLDQVAVQLEPGSIYSSNITILAVEVMNPQAYVEHNPETDTVGEFLKIASSIAARLPTNAPIASATNLAEVVVMEDAEPAPAPAEVLLHALSVEGIRLHVINIGDPQLDVHFGIDAINAALDEGTVSVDHIYFTNPKRLATPNVFALDRITVDFNPESLKADTFVIQDVQVLKPYAFLELNNEANTVGEFMKIANGFTSRIPSYPVPEFPVAAPAPEPLEAKVESSAPPFELHDLLVDDIEVRLLDTTPTNNAPTESHMLAGIEAISVKLVEGTLQINGITIPNVKGFNATNLFHLANIDIAIDPESIHSEQVVINEVFINSPEINLEQTETSGNVAELQTTLKNFAPPPSSAVAAANPTNGVTEIAEKGTNPPPVPLAEQPVVLHSLFVTNFAINLSLPISTNQSAMGMDRIGNLNPLDGKMLKSLNPMSPRENKGTNQQAVATAKIDDGPLTLVSFDLLTLEPLKGLLYIDNMRIANPHGFANEHLATITQFRIDLDPDSIQTDTLIIQDILIDKPRISYERQIMTDNIKAFETEINKATTRRRKMLDTKQSLEITPKPAEESEAQKVIIEHLLVQNGMVRAKLSALPTAPIPLPNIEMSNIGKEDGGTSLSEAGTKLYTAFYDAIIGSVASATGFAGDALKGAGAFTLGALGNVTGGITGGIGSKATETKADKAQTTESPRERRINRRGPGGRRSPVR